MMMIKTRVIRNKMLDWEIISSLIINCYSTKLSEILHVVMMLIIDATILYCVVLLADTSVELAKRVVRLRFA